MGSLQYLFFVAVAFGLGTLISIYTPMISSTSAFMGSPLAGSVVFFAIALGASILMLILVGDVRTILNITTMPAINIFAGLLSAVVIFGVSLTVPILGMRRFVILMIAGQLIMSVVAGHFSMLGVPRDLVTFKKMFGVLLVLVGVYFTVTE